MSNTTSTCDEATAPTASTSRPSTQYETYLKADEELRRITARQHEEMCSFMKEARYLCNELKQLHRQQQRLRYEYEQMWMQVREMMAAQTQMNKNTHQIVALSAVPQLLPSGPFSNFSMMAPTPLDYWSAALQTPFYNQNVVPGNAFSQPWNLTPFPFYEQAQPNNRLKRAPGHMSR